MDTSALAQTFLSQIMPVLATTAGSIASSALSDTYAGVKAYFSSAGKEKELATFEAAPAAATPALKADLAAALATAIATDPDLRARIEEVLRNYKPDGSGRLVGQVTAKNVSIIETVDTLNMN